MNKEMRRLSPMEIVKRAKHDGLWQLQDGFDAPSQWEKNSKGQLFHEFIREIQAKFVTEVGKDEDYLGNKIE